MSEIKPCPFCGSQAKVQINGCPDFTDTWIECDGCGATAGDIESHQAEQSYSIAAWNKRHESSDREQLAMEKLKELLRVDDQEPALNEDSFWADGYTAEDAYYEGRADGERVYSRKLRAILKESEVGDD